MTRMSSGFEGFRVGTGLVGIRVQNLGSGVLSLGSVRG